MTTRQLVVGIATLLAAACDGPGGATGAAAPTESTGSTPAFEVSGSSRRPSFAAQGAADTPVKVEVFAPEEDHHAGIGGAGWFIDMEIEFKGASLQQSGFSGFQLTGPGGHANIPPFPRPGGPGRDESLPSLVVLCSTSKIGAGPGQNLAGLFNLTGITDLTPTETELWDTWIVAGPVCGAGVSTVVIVAVVDDLNHDGIYNDAPDVVPDANGDGRIGVEDVRKLGLASNLVRIPFVLN